MALTHWSNHLARRLKASQDPVISVSVNPGLVRTNIFSNTPSKVKWNMEALFYVLGKNVEQGCQSVLHGILASASDVNGYYISDCRRETIIVSSQLYNPMVEEMLWNYTHDLLESILWSQNRLYYWFNSFHAKCRHVINFPLSRNGFTCSLKITIKFSLFLKAK